MSKTLVSMLSQIEQEQRSSFRQSKEKYAQYILCITGNWELSLCKNVWWCYYSHSRFTVLIFV